MTLARVGFEMTVRHEIPVLTHRWKHLAPSMYLYFAALTPDANPASALETVRALADAIRDSLGIAVEIRFAGGPLLERLEAGGDAQR